MVALGPSLRWSSLSAHLEPHLSSLDLMKSVSSLHKPYLLHLHFRLYSVIMPVLSQCLKTKRTKRRQEGDR